MRQTAFLPPLFLKNRHLQSIASSTPPRKWMVRYRARDFIRASQELCLECDDGVRLQGELSLRPGNNKGLVVMIHGWLGCHESLYLLSAGKTLFDAGYNVFRLNLRDHGPTHHLNKALFTSTRINEVVSAVQQVVERVPSAHNYLVGFSLGGNFALRVAARAPSHGLSLTRVVAVCPVLQPLKTMQMLEDGWFVYHDYFRNRWQRSLREKIKHYPELGYGDEFMKAKTLREMNAYFVPNHTGFETPKDYFNGYAVVGDVLSGLAVDSHIIASDDDPIISSEELANLASNPHISIELTRYGGHCGFMKNYFLDSWIDERLLALISAA